MAYLLSVVIIHGLLALALSSGGLGAETQATRGLTTGHVESFRHDPFLGGRRCWVYLPPGYAQSDQRYPVIYMHDGQNLFDARTSFAGEWEVDEACERLIAAGEIPPLIVVGIENGPERIREYTPWADLRHGGGGGDEYLAAIRDVLKPEVDRRYRTRTGREDTWMAGSSLGGLISAYAGYTLDDVFGRVAAVSPSYWWDDRRLIRWALRRPKPHLARFYQDMGSFEGPREDQNGNGVSDFIEDLRAMRNVAVAQGFVPGHDFRSYEALGHEHHERWWARRFPGMLRFLAGENSVRAGDAATPR